MVQRPQWLWLGLCCVVREPDGDWKKLFLNLQVIVLGLLYHYGGEKRTWPLWCGSLFDAFVRQHIL